MSNFREIFFAAVGDETWAGNLSDLGRFIRHERKAASLSLRDLAARTGVSDPYLSALERGLHEPSIRVLRAIAGALNVQVESLLAIVAGLEGEEETDAPSRTEAAILTDARLTAEQRDALLTVYRTYVRANEA